MVFFDQLCFHPNHLDLPGFELNKMESLYEYRCKNSQQNISKPDPTAHKKDHMLLASWIHPRVTRMVQHTQINQCDTTHQQKKR